jgi:hypothetical protein
MTTKAEAERKHVGRVKRMKCIVCMNLGLIQTSITEAHHLIRDTKTGEPRKMGNRKPDGYATIPLCKSTHHYNGVNVNMARPIFEAQFGNELDLLEQTLALIEMEDEAS